MQTNLTEITRSGNKSTFEYFNKNTNRKISFNEYKFRDLKIRILELSKNQKRKEKRYKKNYNKIIGVQNHKHFNKKPLLKRQRERGIKIKIEKQQFQFNYLFGRTQLEQTDLKIIQNLIINTIFKNQ